MNEQEKEDWNRLKYRMKEEGFFYCFEGYSDWDEIKDEKFHELRLKFLEDAELLKDYINDKCEEI